MWPSGLKSKFINTKSDHFPRGRNSDFKIMGKIFTDLLSIFSSHSPFLFHNCLLLKFSMISNVRYDFTVLLNSQCFWVVCYLSELALCFLKLCVIFYITLDLCIFSDTFQLWSLRHCGRFRFWYMPVNKRENQFSSLPIISYT